MQNVRALAKCLAMNPQFGLSRAKTANSLADLCSSLTLQPEEPAPSFTSKPLRLIESSLVELATRQLAPVTITKEQLLGSCSQHLTDVNTDEIMVVLLSAYFLGHDQPFEQSCDMLLQMARPLLSRDPAPAFSTLTWLQRFIGLVKEPYSSSMERADAFLKLLKEEIAPKKSIEVHDSKLFCEWRAVCLQMKPLLPEDAVEVATKTFVSWLVAAPHSPAEIAAAYSFLNCFFSPLDLYDTLKDMLPHAPLEQRELGLLLSMLWTKQPIDVPLARVVLQTFDKLLDLIEKSGKKAHFQTQLRGFFSHLTQIPITKNADNPLSRSQTILDLTAKIEKCLYSTF